MPAGISVVALVIPPMPSKHHGYLCADTASDDRVLAWHGIGIEHNTQRPVWVDAQRHRAWDQVPKAAVGVVQAANGIAEGDY